MRSIYLYIINWDIGYLKLNLGQETIVDKYDRKFYTKPENGQLHIFNRAFYYTNSNAVTHANDIHNIILAKKRNSKCLL